MDTVLKEIDPDELYYASQVSDYLDIHPNTVKQMYRNGKIEGIQYGGGWIRFPGREIIRILKERTGSYIVPRCPNCNSLLSEILAAGNGQVCTNCDKTFYLTEGKSRKDVPVEAWTK